MGVDNSFSAFKIFVVVVLLIKLKCASANEVILPAPEIPLNNDQLNSINSDEKNAQVQSAWENQDENPELFQTPQLSVGRMTVIDSPQEELQFSETDLQEQPKEEHYFADDRAYRKKCRGLCRLLRFFRRKRRGGRRRPLKRRPKHKPKRKRKKKSTLWKFWNWISKKRRRTKKPSFRRLKLRNPWRKRRKPKRRPYHSPPNFDHGHHHEHSGGWEGDYHEYHNSDGGDYKNVEYGRGVKGGYKNIHHEEYDEVEDEGPGPVRGYGSEVGNENQDFNNNEKSVYNRKPTQGSSRPSYKKNGNYGYSVGNSKPIKTNGGGEEFSNVQDFNEIPTQTGHSKDFSQNNEKPINQQPNHENEHVNDGYNFGGDRPQEFVGGPGEHDGFGGSSDRPQEFQTGGGPQEFQSHGRPDGEQENFSFSGGRPQEDQGPGEHDGFNFGGGGPQEVNEGPGEHDGFNFGGSGPQKGNEGPGEHAGFNFGGGGPQKDNQGPGEHAGFNFGGGDPQEVNQGPGEHDGFNFGGSGPQKGNEGPGEHGGFNFGGGGPQEFQGSERPEEHEPISPPFFDAPKRPHHPPQAVSIPYYVQPDKENEIQSHDFPNQPSPSDNPQFNNFGHNFNDFSHAPHTEQNSEAPNQNNFFEGPPNHQQPQEQFQRPPNNEPINDHGPPQIHQELRPEQNLKAHRRPILPQLRGLPFFRLFRPRPIAQQSPRPIHHPKHKPPQVGHSSRPHSTPNRYNYFNHKPGNSHHHSAEEHQTERPHHNRPPSHYQHNPPSHQNHHNNRPPPHRPHPQYHPPSHQFPQHILRPDPPRPQQHHQSQAVESNNDGIEQAQNNPNENKITQYKKPQNDNPIQIMFFTNKKKPPPTPPQQSQSQSQENPHPSKIRLSLPYKIPPKPQRQRQRMQFPAALYNLLHSPMHRSDPRPSHIEQSQSHEKSPELKEPEIIYGKPMPESRRHPFSNHPDNHPNTQSKIKLHIPYSNEEQRERDDHTLYSPFSDHYHSEADFASTSQHNHEADNQIVPEKFSTLPDSLRNFKPDPSHKKLPQLTYDTM